MFSYGVYGLKIWSDISLALPAFGNSRSPGFGGTGSGLAALAEITLSSADTDFFVREAGSARLNDRWDRGFQYAALPDGRTYVRGWEMGEFLVGADGASIVCNRQPGIAVDAFEVYLMGQALSFALLKRGFEPLHGTAVVIDGHAVGFLGASGVGKSTLAAAFVRAGFRVLTDDVLVVHGTGEGAMAYPGPSRLKLFSNTAARMAANVSGAVRMNGARTKLVIPIDDANAHAAPVPLTAIYDVSLPTGRPGSQKVSMTTLPRRDAVLALVRAGFNPRFVNRDHLARQFSASVALADRVPVKTLSYPRVLKNLPNVVNAVVENIASSERPAVVVPLR